MGGPVVQVNTAIEIFVESQLQTVAGLIWLLLAASLTYTGYALYLVLTIARAREAETNFTPPVTLLKPVCGLDPCLRENLESFCRQAYPSYQIIFGLRSKTDTAYGIVKEVIAQFPDLALDVVVDERLNGTNLKVSNLINMFNRVHHQIVIVSDSDVRVGPDYLRSIVKPFERPNVGATTCLYLGVPSKNHSSRLAAAFINEWFLPSVLVARKLEKLRYCFGATMAVRTSVLKQIGGFCSLRYHLPDDYMLGHLVDRAGYDIVLAPCVVKTLVHEPDISSLLAHEVRWARTISCVRPFGFFSSLLTYSLPLALALVLVSSFSVVSLLGLSSALGLRLALHLAVQRRFNLCGGITWIWVPFREALVFFVWLTNHFTHRITWRGQVFSLRSKGQMIASNGISTP